jgi:hypothetical protein
LNSGISLARKLHLSRRSDTCQKKSASDPNHTKSSSFSDGHRQPRISGVFIFVDTASKGSFQLPCLTISRLFDENNVDHGQQQQQQQQLGNVG